LGSKARQLRQKVKVTSEHQWSPWPWHDTIAIIAIIAIIIIIIIKV